MPRVIFLRQFRSPLVYVLLAAAVLSLGLGHLTDAGFIGFVLVVNALLGAWQELQAERQSANLRDLLRMRATVLRDAVAREIDASQLVRGDIALIERAELTAGSTWHAAAGFHAINDDPHIAALQAYTIKLYQEIEAESGQSVGMHMPGGYSIATTPERWE